MRFYRSDLPSVDEITTVKVVDSNEYGYKVLLMEYNNAEGFVTKSEIIKGRTRKKRLVKINDIIAMSVLRVDKNKNTIDLSKKHVVEDEIKNSEIKYKYCHKMFLIGNDIFGIYKRYCEFYNMKIDMSFENVMGKTIWRLYDELNCSTANCYEKVYTYICTNVEKLIPKGTFDEKLASFIVNNIKSRIVEKNMMQDISISLYVTHEEGVNMIKNMLTIDLKDHTKDYENYDLFVEAVSPPIYKLRLTGPSVNEGEKILNDIVNTIKGSSENYSCSFKTTSSVVLVKEYEIDIKVLGQVEINKIVFE